MEVSDRWCGQSLLGEGRAEGYVETGWGHPCHLPSFQGNYLQMGLGQGLRKATRLTSTCPSPCRAEQHGRVQGRVRGLWQLPQHPQPPQWPQQPLPHRGAACGQLGPILRAAAAGPTGPGLLHCKPWNGIWREDGSGEGHGRGHGGSFRLASWHCLFDTSTDWVSCL